MHRHSEHPDHGLAQDLRQASAALDSCVHDHVRAITLGFEAEVEVVHGLHARIDMHRRGVRRVVVRDLEDLCGFPTADFPGLGDARSDADRPLGEHFRANEVVHPVPELLRVGHGVEDDFGRGGEVVSHREGERHRGISYMHRMPRRGPSGQAVAPDPRFNRSPPPHQPGARCGRLSPRWRCRA